MEKQADEYCEKIFAVLMMSEEKIRFNELHRMLAKFGEAKMSKPTLIEHLNHLLEKKVVMRYEEDKQKVSYSLNWKELEQLQKAKSVNKDMLRQVKNENNFKLNSIENQVIYVTGMLTIGELFYIRLRILELLEPENKLQSYLSYTLIRRLFNIYNSWLLDTCKESKENTQEVLKSIETKIEAISRPLFGLKPE